MKKIKTSIAQYVTRVRLQEEGKAVMACKQNCIGKNLTPELMHAQKGAGGTHHLFSAIFFHSSAEVN